MSESGPPVETVRASEARQQLRAWRAERIELIVSAHTLDDLDRLPRNASFSRSAAS